MNKKNYDEYFMKNIRKHLNIKNTLDVIIRFSIKVSIRFDIVELLMKLFE